MAKKIHTVESMRADAYWEADGTKHVAIGYPDPVHGQTAWLVCYYNARHPRMPPETKATFNFSYTDKEVTNDKEVTTEEAAAILHRQKALLPKVKKPKAEKPSKAEKPAKEAKAEKPAKVGKPTKTAKTEWDGPNQKVAD